ncbi:MAG TPA: formate dehydrogenase subunit gamma, partial [Burkholderiales bacterium]|nr:formate dehydrogenase subunit gamma [Burkholderiales bacterium]
ITRLCLAVLVSLAGAAAAQQSPTQEQQQRQMTQPGNNAPVWRQVREEGKEHYTSIKGRETGVLVQSAGDTWRRIRNGPVTFWGGWAVIAVLAVIAALYFAKGPIKLHERPTGRLILRFSTLEQVAHWCMAISFCVLGISGLIMLFGKYVLLPVIGYTLFAWLTSLAKNLHNFVGPFFIVSTLIFVVMFIRDNLPRAYDFMWFRKSFGYMLGGEHVPSGRFNAGEKAWFWGGVVVLSVIVAWTGLILLFPNFDQTRATMQEAWVWHAVAALVYMAVALGHIYMGTIGVEGAYASMRTGYVDEIWAKEHHEYWYNEVKSGKAAAARGAVPAGAPHMREKS